MRRERKYSGDERDTDIIFGIFGALAVISGIVSGYSPDKADLDKRIEKPIPVITQSIEAPQTNPSREKDFNDYDTGESTLDSRVVKRYIDPNVPLSPTNIALPVYIHGKNRTIEYSLFV